MMGFGGSLPAPHGQGGQAAARPVRPRAEATEAWRNKGVNRSKNKTSNQENLRCSFCHKSQDAVAKLISSPSDYPRAYICDECVAVCNSILEDDRAATPPASTPNTLPKPQEVK